MNLVRKYLNYLFFGGVVMVVVFLAVNHSRHMRGLVDDLGSPDQKTQSHAAIELIRGEQFMDSITGEPTPTRIHAVEALETLGNDTSVVFTPPKDKTAPQDKDDNGDPDFRAQAVKQCLAMLKDTDKPVRDRAVQALKKIGDSQPANLDALVGGLGDGDAYVRKGTMTALEAPDGIGPRPEVVDKIVERIKADANSRSPGGDVLSSKTFMTPEAKAQSVKGLLAVLTDRDPKNPAKYANDDAARSGACDALGKIGDPSAIPALIAAMQEGSAQLRPAAIGAIALIADRSGERALTEALSNGNDDSDARAQAAAGLGKIGSPTAIASLIKTLQDEDLKLRSAAVAALARATRPTPDGPVDAQALGALNAALKDSDENVRLGAARALQTVGSQAVDPGLLSALKKDTSADVRAAAAAALGFTGNRSAVEPLIHALSDPTGRVRTAARDALASIGQEATDTLVAVMQQGGTNAYYASQALAQQGASALPALKRAAQSPSPLAERWAAVTLGDLGGADRETSDILRKLSHSTDPDVAYVAAEQLGRLGQTQ